ncbi:hypothetical protein Taro_029414 [Colocasia esculenta]|uniref:Protease Do-like 8, chloroplastic n=1 Tax=Colocasia esculenta TaxID=4460 RepID=A0A843VR30_COLES|nr:hypothetical protein [Colocasia esculenta]
MMADVKDEVALALVMGSDVLMADMKSNGQHGGYKEAKKKVMLQVVAASDLPVQPHHILRAPLRRFGRRKVFFDGASSVCSRSSSSGRKADMGADAEFSSSSLSPRRAAVDCGDSFNNFLCKNFPSTTRRSLLASVVMYLSVHPSRYLSVLALGDPSATIEDVSPTVYPSGPLFPSEERIAELFEKNTYSVVNIFDVTLRPQLNVTGAVEVPEGNGSGVVWDGEGHIVTNYHVVGSALSRNPSPGQVVARVNILASEGVQKNFEGKLVGADRAKDLAILKVDAPPDLLKPINVGKSSVLKVGQQCLAIGNPFGFDHTLTVGVISGLNREIFSQTGVTIGGGIQTDAAINPGNSGGPLLDSKGNLIGINTAIFTQTGTSAGVGFAIPSSTVLRIVPQLIQFGKVSLTYFTLINIVSLLNLPFAHGQVGPPGLQTRRDPFRVCSSNPYIREGGGGGQPFSWLWGGLLEALFGQKIPFGGEEEDPFWGLLFLKYAYPFGAVGRPSFDGDERCAWVDQYPCALIYRGCGRLGVRGVHGHGHGCGRLRLRLVHVQRLHHARELVACESVAKRRRPEVVKERRAVLG